MPRSAAELEKLAKQLARKPRRLQSRTTSKEYDRLEGFINTLVAANWGGRAIVNTLVEEGEIPNKPQVIRRYEVAIYRRVLKHKREQERIASLSPV